MKKILLGLGTLATIVAPLMAVVACGSEDKTGNTNPTKETQEGEKDVIWASYISNSIDNRPDMTEISRRGITEKVMSDLVLNEIISEFHYTNISHDHDIKTNLEQEYIAKVNDKISDSLKKDGKFSIDEAIHSINQTSEPNIEYYLRSDVNVANGNSIMSVNTKTNEIKFCSLLKTWTSESKSSENYQNIYKSNSFKGAFFKNVESLIKLLNWINWNYKSAELNNRLIEDSLKSLIPFGDSLWIDPSSEECKPTVASYNKESVLVKGSLELLSYTKSFDMIKVSPSEIRSEYGLETYSDGGFTLFTRAKYLPEKLEFDTSIYSSSETENLRYINGLNKKIHALFADRDDFLSKLLKLFSR